MHSSTETVLRTVSCSFDLTRVIRRESVLVLWQGSGCGNSSAHLCVCLRPGLCAQQPPALGAAGFLCLHALCCNISQLLFVCLFVVDCLPALLQYTCIAASDHYVACGANTGGVYLFARHSRKYLQLISNKVCISDDLGHVVFRIKRLIWNPMVALQMADRCESRVEKNGHFE